MERNYVTVTLCITMAVDDQSEISHSIHQGRLPWQPVLLVLSTASNTFVLIRRRQLRHLIQ